VHVAADLTARSHLGHHRRKLVVTLRKADRLTGERRRRFPEPACSVQPVPSALAALAGPISNGARRNRAKVFITDLHVYRREISPRRLAR
jgi:hypothetical protein